MTHTDRTPNPLRRTSARIGGALAMLLLAGLLFATAASATFEQVDTFGDKDGDMHLYGSRGAAVNVTGVGGVPAGSLYTGSRHDASGVTRWGPKGEFLGHWGGFTAEGIAVDQANGNVYVLEGGSPGQNQIEVYTADGSELITSFGERAASSETVSQSPEKIHDATASGIAIDSSGTVYVADIPSGGDFKAARVMVFEPQSPGDFSHYVYAGQGNDIAVGKIGSKLAIDAANNLYVVTEDQVSIEEYAPGSPNTPICRYETPSRQGGIFGMTVNPIRGEVFYYSFKDAKVHQLSACSEGKFKETAKFGATPKPSVEGVEALAFNPSLAWDASRPAGVLYAADSSFLQTEGVKHGQGYIFAAPQVFSPQVEAESIAALTATTATLRTQINPKGSATRYAFQYLTDAAYEANDPDERQSLTVSASSGTFSLSTGGHSYGGTATATLTSGSSTASSLVTGSATATLHGASGTATLKAAKGTGTAIAGSTTLTAVSASEGTFEVGQVIGGEGIPANTTIKAVKAGELTLSQAPTASKAGITLNAGSTTLTAVSTSEGSFEVGQRIEGEGIASSTITAVKAGELVISSPPFKAGTGVAIHAASNKLTAVSISEGAFEVGQQVSGKGIAEGSEITAVGAGELTLSSPITIPATGVAISSEGPNPFAVGQRLEGPGIPPNTEIAAIKKAGELTLSNPATASGTAVHLHAGLPFDASAGRVGSALESLPAIGKGNVQVSGGPGDEAGSSPYEIRFIAALRNTDLPLIGAGSEGLSGGGASATVQGENDGGGGFDSGATEVPLGGAALGSGQEALSAAAALSGLQPDSGYHFRAVATSHCNPDEEEALCEDTGLGQAFHTFPLEAPGLPDNRAWELVSPAQKHGGEVIPSNPAVGSCFECKPGSGAGTGVFPRQSSLDGEAVVYEGFPFSFTEGAVKFNEYLSKRTSAGWQTTTLSPLLQNGDGTNGYKAFNASLTQGLLYQTNPTLSPEAPAEYANLYAQPTAAPLTLSSLLLSEPPNRPGGQGFKLFYAGASADLSRIFFAANDALTGETAFAPEAEDGGAEKNNLYEWAGGQMRLVNVLPGNAEAPPGPNVGDFGFGPASAHTISADGSRVFWSSPTGQVYVRIDGESTIAIPDPGKFLAASADGSKVLLGNGHLFDLGGEEPTVQEIADLSEGEGGFEGILGQSKDLSQIYFVDTAVLDEGENDQGAVAQAGKDNLYAWQGGTSSFVATLLPEDGPASDGLGDWAASPSRRTAEASPNGRWVAFLSKAQLSGYDNIGPCRHSGSGVIIPTPCPEAFLYDSATGKLTCVSCNPSGAHPPGPTHLALIGNAPDSLPQPRYLTDAGRLYFDTQDSLTPFDTNNGVEDVYQYEPEGVGTPPCKRQAGCVNLISAGHEAVDSNFVTMDETGQNVFFTTRDQLVLKDKDELVDLYDARENGGIPAESEVARSECQGEACQAAIVAPNDPTPGSSSFEGAGNVDERKATKKHKHKKHKHAKKHKRNKRAHGRANQNRGGAR